MHDLFNVLAVVILFPLQLTTNFLGRLSTVLEGWLRSSGGFTLVNPIKLIVDPVAALIARATGDSGTIMLLISIVLLFLALRYIIRNLKILVVERVEVFFDTILFKTAPRAFLFGVVLTIMVQSSSISTSLAVPLAGAGILTLRQIFPMTLGANLGTTITAMLAALVTGSSAAVTVAFAHISFNVFGIVVIWPIRQLPLYCANILADLSTRSRLVPFIYVGALFFLIPLTLIYLMG